MTSLKIYQPLEAVRGAADIIDEVNPDIIYMGFRNPRAADLGEDKYVWSILRIEKLLDIIRFEWADGYMNFDKQWTQRVGYNYYFKKG